MTGGSGALLTSSVGAALLTGIFHTLIPDHWLPFALIGRARGWSGWRTGWVAVASGILHVMLSIVLALLALGAGRSTASFWGETLEQAGPYLLIVFGLLYALWSWRKGGHFHPGGDWVHGADAGHHCSGDEGPSHPEHLHYHADEGWIRNKSSLGAWALALLVGANPCVLLMPIVVAADGNGRVAMTAVLLSYAIPTILLMGGLSAFAVARLRAIKLPAGVRFMEPVSGLLVAVVGVVVLLIHRLAG
ncbi:MAG: hypothetical protein OES25_08115 [Acidobacteriota bacterium]|nr:hypothetical protein [Acidobacteriota bacterium]